MRWKREPGSTVQKCVKMQLEQATDGNVENAMLITRMRTYGAHVSSLLRKTRTRENAPAEETLAKIFEGGRLDDELVDLCLHRKHFVGAEVASSKLLLHTIIHCQRALVPDFLRLCCIVRSPQEIPKTLKHPPLKMSFSSGRMRR